MTNSTPPNIAALLEAAEKAPIGPYTVECDDEELDTIIDGKNHCIEFVVNRDFALFIAAARNAVPDIRALVAKVDELEGYRESFLMEMAHNLELFEKLGLHKAEDFKNDDAMGAIIRKVDQLTSERDALQARVKEMEKRLQRIIDNRYATLEIVWEARAALARSEGGSTHSDPVSVES